MIELRSVGIQIGDFRLDDISLIVPRGHYAALMGPTGQGKTTILESICGLRQIQTGSVLLHGVDVTNWLPGDRQVGYVPQDLGLFPKLSVREHFAFAMKLRKQKRQAIRDRCHELAELLGLSHLLDRTVHGLSGGESQRVALGRALSFRPPVLVLDEPFSALDKATRAEMRAILKEVKRTTETTVLHVTHNQDEATALADHHFELHDGSIVVR
ncbi:ABC transporter [Neorhodopirellula lusitana]|uniref:ABC transporter n=1 Tax=Neorhodopirellula lusitana TaxID=445327 RepID=A0ABY1QGK8_9BACT|nr:ABC transporter ATP-binding protein [Neorhodopirellula lusitana]SMP70676.1 ABC transporter [Neorhodopirellula lusitana]